MSGATTIGFVSLTLLSLVSTASRRGILGERTRLAYGRLRAQIADWADSDATIFDEIQMQDSRRRWIIDAIELRAKDDRVSVRSMATLLAEALRQDVLRGSLGISLRRLEEIDAQLRALA